MGAALRARGAEVSLIDLRLPGTTIEADDPADVLLLWGEAPGEVAALAADLHRLLSGREFLAGGPGLDPDALLGGKLADLVLLDGDVPALDRWYRARLQGRGVAGCRGLAWRAPGGAVVREPALAPPVNADALPAPAWDMLDLADYGSSTPLVSGRSCGPRCRVCHHSFGHSFRARSLEHVLAEVEELIARGAHEVVIEDEPFNLDPKRAAELLREIVRRGPGLRIRLAYPLRPDRVDEGLAQALSAAGIVQVELELEGVSRRAQREARLNLSLEAAERGIEHLASAGVLTRGRFTLGRPGETREERRATVQWARRSALDHVRFSGGTGRRRAWFWFQLAPRRLWRRVRSRLGR